MGVCSFAVLLLLQGRSAFSIPNAVSLLRLVLLIAGVVRIFFRGQGFGVFTLFALAGLSDFFDGLAARRFGSTPFGAKLDMELDAVFIFVLAAVAHVYYGQARLVLVAGLLRYGYVFLIPLLPDSAEMPAIARLLSKGACALAEIALIAITAPVLGETVRIYTSLSAVCLLCSSFVLDAVLRLLLGSNKRSVSRQSVC
jgi:phosphatidylglycerophosphate synthase